MADTLTTLGGWAPAIRDGPFGHSRPAGSGRAAVIQDLKMSDASQRKAIVARAQAITTKSQAYSYASEVAQHAATLRATKLAAQAGEPAPIHSST